MADLAASAAAQIIVVLALALIVWLFGGRGRGAFFRHVGLVPTPPAAALLGAAFGAFSLVALLGVPAIRLMAGAENTVVRSVEGMAAAPAILGIILLAVFKTAFAEELLFRGVIAKRLISWLGFGLGNTVQALIFGAVHLVVLLSPAATAEGTAAIVAFTALTAWFACWLNETLGRGSILPGWAAHATANLGSYLLAWNGGF